MMVERTARRTRAGHRLGRHENRKAQLMLATQKDEEERERGSERRNRKRMPGHVQRSEVRPNVKDSLGVTGDKEGVLQHPAPAALRGSIRQRIDDMLLEEHEKKKLPKFPRLSTLGIGKLYVQAGDEHFKATKVLPSRNGRSKQLILSSPPLVPSLTAEANNNECRHMPIRFAILLQRFVDTVGFISRGFLAGMALTHFLMIHVVYSDSSKVALHPVDFSRISQLYSNLFSCFIALCLASLLDKYT